MMRGWTVWVMNEYVGRGEQSWMKLGGWYGRFLECKYVLIQSKAILSELCER